MSLTPIILNKPGERGGDIKFVRAQRDIGSYLKQRADTWITLLVDYYGIKADWPGYAEAKQQQKHIQKAAIMNGKTAEEVQRLFPEQNRGVRFIPYVSMHEFESLYFSDPACLAFEIGVPQNNIDEILLECGEPENINDNRATAPSKRLQTLSRRFKKTTSGIEIAKKIGIPKMRAACPLFNDWLTRLETLPQQSRS